ncbi:MAG: CRISPR-associated protein Csx3 [Thermosphaera sp.]
MAAALLEKMRIEKLGNTAMITFNLMPTDVVQYSDLPDIINKVHKELQYINAEVIMIMGRGPIWLYSAVVHVAAHLAKAVAVYDAINKKYVIVVSHTNIYRIGEAFE